ncbi:MAG: Hsp20 family protein [Methanobacteriaceae archaeon]|nr:Hsp20 family protein [Methanobacteriaceae archaeon]
MKSEIKGKVYEIMGKSEDRINKIKENDAKKRAEIAKQTEAKINEIKENRAKKEEEISKQTQMKIKEIKDNTTGKGEEIRGKSEAKIKEIKEDSAKKREEIRGKSEAKIKEIKENDAKKKEEISKQTQMKIYQIKENAAGKKIEIRSKAYEINEKIQESEVIKSTENFLNDMLDTIRQKQKEFEKNISYYSMTQNPVTDIMETNDALIIKIDLPGLNKEDLKVDIGEDYVCIKAKYPEENKAEDVNYIQKERNDGTIMKIIPLPPSMEYEYAKASFTNSILTIKVPKKQKESYRLDIKS